MLYKNLEVETNYTIFYESKLVRLRVFVYKKAKVREVKQFHPPSR
jgi:hypothetical protein